MLNRRIAFSLLLIALLVAAAYGTEYSVKSWGLRTASVIKIQNNNTPAALLDINVLRQLDPAGPSLTAVLAAAGVDGFNRITVKGLKINGIYELRKSEITKDLNFNFTDRGTVNLYSKERRAVLVEDVSVINAIY